MGQENEFKRLFRECYPQLYAFAYGMVRDEETCRDIVGDAFERLWSRLDDVADGSERSFLYRIIRNKCIDRIRSSVSHQRYETFYKTIYGDETDEEGAKSRRRKTESQRCIISSTRSLPRLAESLKNAISTANDTLT